MQIGRPAHRRASVGLYGRVLLTRSKHNQDCQRLIRLGSSPTFQLDQDVIVGPPIASAAPLRRETRRINRSRDTLARRGAKTVPEWTHWIEFLGGGNLQGGLTPTPGDLVMKKYVIAGLLVAGFATPAFAAEFFVA